MEFQGRSPIKDVVRSVVMSAGMIAPAAFAGCSKDEPVNPPPGNGETSGGVQSADSDAGAADSGAMQDAAADVTQAPPPVIVRPRSNNDGREHEMPTRGFAGGRRPRSARG